MPLLRQRALDKWKGVTVLKKKKWLIVILIIIGLIGIGISRIFPSYSSVLKANWGISLPVKAFLSEEYEKDAGVSFHGDGVRYHVFSYKYEDYIDLMFAWPPTEYPTNYYSTTSEAAEAWLDEIDVPNDKRPYYSYCSSWHKSKDDNSEIIFFWNSEMNLLYIVENFI